MLGAGTKCIGISLWRLPTESPNGSGKNGTDRAVKSAKFVDIPYKRYLRTCTAPPSIQMRIGVTTEGEKLVFTSPIEFIDDNEQLLVHSVNLYLEMFRECIVLTENLEEIIRSPVVQLSWRALPPGHWPWAELRKEVDSLIEQAPGGTKQ
jgi:hypothetical protein